MSYNGKNYHGWQMQPDAVSVQEKINHALSTVWQEEIEVVGAGRTDTGVHAKQMFAHFDSNTAPKEEIVYKLNSILPNDIVIYKLFEVNEEQHARFERKSTKL